MKSADKAAKILKGLEERITSLEEDGGDPQGVQKFRGTQENITVTQNVKVTATNQNTGETTVSEAHNAITTEMMNYLSRCLRLQGDPPERPTHIALGTGDPDIHKDNTELDEHIRDIQIVESTLISGGNQVLLTANLDSTELNTYTLTELAVVNDNRFFNHAPIDPQIEKTEAVTVTIEIRFGFQN